MCRESLRVEMESMRECVSRAREWSESEVWDVGFSVGRRVKVEDMVGSRSSIVSRLRGGATGERIVEVSCWKRRVWWVRWVDMATWAVVSLEEC
jgi:hypothetical protein